MTGGSLGLGSLDFRESRFFREYAMTFTGVGRDLDAEDVMSKHRQRVEDLSNLPIEWHQQGNAILSGTYQNATNVGRIRIVCAQVSPSEVDLYLLTEERPAQGNSK